MAPASAQCCAPSTVVESLALASRTGALHTCRLFFLPLAESSSFYSSLWCSTRRKCLGLCVSIEKSCRLPPGPPVFLHSRGVGSPMAQPLGVGGSTEQKGLYWIVAKHTALSSSLFLALSGCLRLCSSAWVSVQSSLSLQACRSQIGSRKGYSVQISVMGVVVVSWLQNLPLSPHGQLSPRLHYRL